MHALFDNADALRRDKGPGLIESIYENCLGHELRLRNIVFIQQRVVRVQYKGFVFDEPQRIDLLVDGCLLPELKYVESVLPIHKAQLLSYMKLLDVPVGLLISFHEDRLVDGISRLILPGAKRRKVCTEGNKQSEERTEIASTNP
jgi:GxxExxY protein